MSTHNYNTTQQPAWMTPMVLLLAFVEEHGRLPRQSGDLPPVEQAAGDILRHHRRVAAGKVAGAQMPVVQREWLDENIPGWLTESVRPSARGLRSRSTFEARVLKVSRFVAKHGRTPLASSKDVDEARMGKFLGNARQAAQGRGTMKWNDSRRLLLNRLVPGWDASTEQRIKVSPTLLVISA